MSADNFIVIKKKAGKFVVVYGVASNDYTSEKGTFDDIEDAIKQAQSFHTEYGISFNLKDEANPTRVDR